MTELTLREAITRHDCMLSVTLDCSNCNWHTYGCIEMSNTCLDQLECPKCLQPTQRVSEVFCVSGKVTRDVQQGDVFQAKSFRYQCVEGLED